MDHTNNTIKLYNVLPFQFKDFWEFYNYTQKYLGSRYNELDAISIATQYRIGAPFVPKELQKQMICPDYTLFEFKVSKSFLQEKAFEYLVPRLPQMSEIKNMLKEAPWNNPRPYEDFVKRMYDCALDC
ncbi:hypothetical protein [Flectobacillus longus]|uniref:hypothetical protein n=1 Tax=Flectobacillus longus TaxID=2984207 RepID=UPI0024B79851|nr:hypothetical protein [Flectobacillus longus]MDI9880875.1 hypothetical protein [Flectobacillus longus]